MSARIYMDHNATTPLRPEACDAMVAALHGVGNPSSVHWHGRDMRARIEASRETIAQFVGASPNGIVFTSGGTEANNMIMSADWDVIAVSSMEHESVLASAERRGAELYLIPALRSGVIDLDALRYVLQQARSTGVERKLLVSVQMANNETGVVQPVAEAAAIAKAFDASIHTDAVQAAGKLPIDMAALDVDYLTISAHKLGGPTGVGALVLRDGLNLPAMICGGGQERRSRAGTENIAGIIGFGRAIECSRAERNWIGNASALRETLESGIREITPSAIVIAKKENRISNTTCVAVPGTRAETLIIALDLAGVSVSAGAACSSGKVAQSHVLRAMGLAPSIAEAAIRISLGWTSTEQDVARFLDAWERVHHTENFTPSIARTDRSEQLAV